jgi:hypothetical protein
MDIKGVEFSMVFFNFARLGSFCGVKDIIDIY